MLINELPQIINNETLENELIILEKDDELPETIPENIIKNDPENQEPLDDLTTVQKKRPRHDKNERQRLARSKKRIDLLRVITITIIMLLLNLYVIIYS